MQQRYSVRQNDDGKWVVSAEGREIFVFIRKYDALKVAKEANELFKRPVIRNRDGRPRRG